MKTVKTGILFSILIFSFFACKKEEDTFTIMIKNPYNFDIEIGSNAFVGGEITAKASKTYTGDVNPTHGVSLSATETGDNTLLGGMNGSLVFYPNPGEKFEWTAGTGEVVKEGSEGSGITGYWKKHDGTGFIHLSGSTAKFCQKSSGDEWTGSFSASQKTIDINLNGQEAHFEVKVSGDTLILIQNFSDGHSNETTYYRSNSSEYPC